MPSPSTARATVEILHTIRNMVVLLTEKVKRSDAKDSDAGGFIFDEHVDIGTFKIFQGYIAKAKDLFASVIADKANFDKHDSFNVLIKSKIESYLQVEGRAKRFYFSKQQDLLQKAVEVATPHAGGSDDGGEWSNNLPMQPTWEAYEMECKKTLLTNELVGRELPSMRKRVLED